MDLTTGAGNAADAVPLVDEAVASTVVDVAVILAAAGAAASTATEGPLATGAADAKKTGVTGTVVAMAIVVASAMKVVVAAAVTGIEDVTPRAAKAGAETSSAAGTTVVADTGIGTRVVAGSGAAEAAPTEAATGTVLLVATIVVARESGAATAGVAPTEDAMATGPLAEMTGTAIRAGATAMTGRAARATTGPSRVRVAEPHGSAVRIANAVVARVAGASVTGTEVAQVAGASVTEAEEAPVAAGTGTGIEGGPAIGIAPVVVASIAAIGTIAPSGPGTKIGRVVPDTRTATLPADTGEEKGRRTAATAREVTTRTQQATGRRARPRTVLGTSGAVNEAIEDIEAHRRGLPDAKGIGRQTAPLAARAERRRKRRSAGHLVRSETSPRASVYRRFSARRVSRADAPANI